MIHHAATRSTRSTRSTRRPAARPRSDYPRRPWLTALWIPVTVLALPVGGGVMAFGGWLMVPGLVLLIGGAVGLISTMTLLCAAPALRWVALLLLFAPLIGVPILAMHATQDSVLAARGTAHRATVTRVTVSRGKTTTYRCTVRYDDQPDRTRTVDDCSAYDTAGERTEVTDDPGGWVGPRFTVDVEGSGFTRTMTLFFTACLLAVATVLGAAGILLHALAARRRG
ncbi:hypothetical protein ACFW1A_15350 [Kitasatospora sp. NPDC058965]|uniref:hypothetical protein n=1 Tax=Kitasatospora sp. NPDC058965 TaxID=3346682 RepID=UPI00367B38F0